MIRLNDVKVIFKDKVALDLKGQIEIHAGDRVGIIGSNGAGKSTLVKSILGLVDYSGRIQTAIPSREIAIHMQQNEYSSLVPIRVILETIIGMPLEKNQKIMDMIDFFQFQDCLKKRWKQLSGGQKQRLTLLLVLCQESPITMLDEVTSALDFETRQSLIKKLMEWYQNQSSTLLIISHYYEELDYLADKILFLDNGHLIAYGKKQDLFAKYCGYSVLIAKECPETLALKKDYPVLKGGPNTVVFTCPNVQVEEELITKLIHLNINYRRSNNDTEIMTLNAKAAYYGEEF